MDQEQRRRSKQIEMQSNPNNLNQTQRAMKAHLIQNQHRQSHPRPSPYSLSKNINSREQRDIFDDDFEVEEMSDPQEYIPNYNQNNFDTQNCMTSFQQCCGSCCLSISMICPLFCAKCCVYELQTSSAGLVQKFGKFSHLLRPGFNRLNPCSEQVHEVDMRIRLLSTGRNVVISRDNVKLTVETSIAFRVVNPIIVFYKLGGELERAVMELVISSFRKIIGSHLLQDVLTDRSIIVKDVIEEVRTNMTPGVFIENVFLEDILVPPEIENGLSSVARQKRVSQANIINSKADVESAGLMKQSAELLDTKAAMQIRYLELFQELGKRGVTVMMDIGVNKRGFKDYQKDRKEQNFNSQSNSEVSQDSYKSQEKDQLLFNEVPTMNFP